MAIIKSTVLIPDPDIPLHIEVNSGYSSLGSFLLYMLSKGGNNEVLPDKADKYGGESPNAFTEQISRGDGSRQPCHDPDCWEELIRI